MIIGGPGFNNKSIASEWLKLKSVKAIVGAEVDGFLSDLITSYFNGESISKYPGVFTAEQPSPKNDYIYQDLNDLPIPDYSDFPWEKYPMKIIPFMTGRGCKWGQCNFCTDVTYVNGRTFRSMSETKVLEQLRELSKLNSSNIFYFSDLKLNSHLKVWNALINELPKYVDSPKWFATVHVDGKKENGLDEKSIRKAKEAGLIRISFGLETASQRLLDHMKKGTRIDRVEKFINYTSEAQVSLRATMFIGYPYENAEDLKLTYEFLKRNKHCFDRISLSKFQLFEMAPIYEQVKKEFEDKKIINPKYNHRINMTVKRDRSYKHYKHKILREINIINSKPLRKEAIAFDGVM